MEYQLACSFFLFGYSAAAMFHVLLLDCFAKNARNNSAEWSPCRI